MRKLLPILLASIFLLTSGFALAQSITTDPSSADASTSSDSSGAHLGQITFPIPELGNCASKDECRAYCSDSAHSDACLAFAQTHGLMKSDEVKKARDFVKLKGPSGCVGEACKIYCQDSAHAEECISFAKANHLISDVEAKVADDIRTNGGPGGCKSAIECRTFCADPINHDTCVQFAQGHGLTAPREIGSADASSTGQRRGETGGRIAEILATKPGPGGCTDTVSCKTYCSDSAHITECVQFAKDNGLMTQDQADQARKFQRPGPGGCVGEACKAYCRDTAHLDECRQFAIQNGFMPKDGGAGSPENGSSTPMGRPEFQGPRGPRDGQASTSRPGLRPMIDTSSLKGRCASPDECKRLLCTEHPDACENGVPKLNRLNQGTDGAQPPMPPKPAMPTQEQIQERCAQYGGTWDGQRCLRPSMPGTNTSNGSDMPRPPVQPPQGSPTSMAPLTGFTASVFAILQSLFR